MREQVSGRVGAAVDAVRQRLGGEAPSSGPRVVLLGRRGCHLCAAAREVVVDVAARTGTAWREVDVDAPDPRDERLAGGAGAPGALVARWGELVPVVLVDGVQHAVLRVDADGLERTLGRAPGRRRRG